MSDREKLRKLAHIFKGFVDQTIHELDTCCPGHTSALLELYERFMADTKSSLMGQAHAAKKDRN